MTRILSAIFILVALIGAAHAFGLGLGNRFGHLGSGAGKAVVVVQPTGKILQVDGVSHILQVDGISKICRAGGC